MSLLSFLRGYAASGPMRASTRHRWLRRGAALVASGASLATSPVAPWRVETEAQYVDVATSASASTSRAVTVRVEGHAELRRATLVVTVCGPDELGDGGTRPTPTWTLDGVAGNVELGWYGSEYGYECVTYEYPSTASFPLASRCADRNPCDVPLELVVAPSETPWSARLRLRAAVVGDQSGEPPPGRVTMTLDGGAP